MYIKSTSCCLIFYQSIVGKLYTVKSEGKFTQSCAMQVLDYMDVNVRQTYQHQVDISKQYHKDAEDMDNILKQFSEVAQSISKENESIMNVIENLQRATSDGAIATEEVAHSAEGMLNGTHKLQEAGAGLGDIIHKMEDTIAAFQVPELTSDSSIGYIHTMEENQEVKVQETEAAEATYDNEELDVDEELDAVDLEIES